MSGDAKWVGEESN